VHGYTHAGHQVTASVALETLKIYEETYLQAMSGGRLGVSGNLGRLTDYPLVGDFSCVGLIGGR
jgi:4-aminobutyrate---pyruvate transaminase